MRYNEIITESKKASPQAIQAVLNWFKKQIEEHHEDIDFIIGSAQFPEDYQAAFGITDIADAEAIDNMRTSQWEHAFKSAFGMTDHKYLQKCQAEHDETFSPEDMALLKFLSSQTTVRIRPRPDGTFDGISFYMVSPQKMVFRTHSMEAVILAKELEAIGWSMETATEFLIKHGAEKIKRPVRPKAGRFSYYD